MDRCPGRCASCDTPRQYTIAIQARNIARAPISIRRTSIGHLYRVMPRRFGDGEHRQETQHPPVTHGLLARKLYRAFARTVPKEEQLTNASAALPPSRRSALGELRPCHDRRKAWSGWRVKPAANTRSHNESTPVARCSNRPGASRGLRLHDIIRRKISARMPVPTEYQVKG